jgi:hypothetical protein
MIVLGESEIMYRDFCDVPRIFIVRYRGRSYLFDCSFNGSVEDYEETYSVYVLPELPGHELSGSWKYLAEKAESDLGEVPVVGVGFDPSMRRAINTRVIDELLDTVRVGVNESRRT